MHGCNEMQCIYMHHTECTHIILSFEWRWCFRCCCRCCWCYNGNNPKSNVLNNKLRFYQNFQERELKLTQALQSHIVTYTLDTIKHEFNISALPPLSLSLTAHHFHSLSHICSTLRLKNVSLPNRIWYLDYMYKNERRVLKRNFFFWEVSLVKRKHVKYSICLKAKTLLCVVLFPQNFN